MIRGAAAVAALCLVAGVRAVAQQVAEPTPHGLAPIDLTGYWVSIVNEDWRGAACRRGVEL